MFTHTTGLAVVLGVATAVAAAAQVSAVRERARPHFRTGWEYMRIEAWPEAANAFQQAIDADAEFEDAYYGLGRANMSMKKYDQAIAAYTRCRDLYRSYAGRHFANQQDAQRYRQDRMVEIDESIRQLQTGPQTLLTQDRIRQLQEQRRQIQQNIQRGASMTIENSVPASVSLALGSAYFRSGKLADAEREYKVAVAADPRTGEAHNNLAVVYLEMGRLPEAERSVAAAEKAGHKVHPQLKEDIKARKKDGSA